MVQNILNLELETQLTLVSKFTIQIFSSLPLLIRLSFIIRDSEIGAKIDQKILSLLETIQISILNFLLKGKTLK